MARTYGAIYLEIWRDKDFRALSHTEQYVYWALIFQPKLNGVGLLDYMPDRWAEATGDMTTADVEITIKSLIAKRYVVHDPSTHELLIRTYVRSSKVWKMPKAFAGVIPAAVQIQSPMLRRVLLADLDKIPLDELSEAPGTNGGPSVRSKIDGYLMKLRAVLDDGEPDDPAGLDEPDAQPPQGNSSDPERVSVPDAYRTDTESANPVTSTRVRACAVPIQVHVPVQVPNPSALASVTLLPVPAAPEPEAALQQGDEGALFGFEDAAGKPQPNAGGAKPKASQPKKADKPAESSRGTRIPADFAITDSMREWGKRRAPHVNGQLATEEFVNYWIALPGAKALKLDWVRTWQNRMLELEQRALERMPAQRGPQPIPPQRQSATAQRTQAGLDLIQQFAAEEGVDVSALLPSNVIPIRREISA